MASTGAYTEPRTMAVGTTGSAADWNTYVRTNMSSVANRVHLNLNSTTSPARLSATNYQNTTAGLLFVNVGYGAATNSTPDVVGVAGFIGSSSTTITLTAAYNQVPQTASTLSNPAYSGIMFAVPVSWWYKITLYGSASVLDHWAEWAMS